MKNRYSWNFLVPEFSILEYSVWKFSVLGFYFPENSGIRCVCLFYSLTYFRANPLPQGIESSGGDR